MDQEQRHEIQTQQGSCGFFLHSCMLGQSSNQGFALGCGAICAIYHNIMMSHNKLAIANVLG